MAAFEGELDDEDGVLGEKADEHDEGDLEVNVVGDAEDVGEDERSHEAEGDREDYGEGEDVALVLGGEEEVDEQQAEAEDDGGGAARALVLLTRHAGVFVAEALGECLLGHALDGGDGLAGRVALGGVTGDGDRREHVEAVHQVGTVDAAQADEVGDGGHLGTVADLDGVEGLGRDAVFGSGLHHDAVDLTEAVEVGHVHTAVVALERMVWGEMPACLALAASMSTMYMGNEGLNVV